MTSTESLSFEGYAIDDPQEVIALGIHPLRLSPGGNRTLRWTESGGASTGRFYATPIDGPPDDP